GLGHKTRERSGEVFYYVFSHPRHYWNNLTPVEKKHTVETFNYNLRYVKSKSVRQQVVDMFANVEKEMATVIAENIGVNPPSKGNVPVTKSSPTLSLANQPHYAYTQKVGSLIGNGCNGEKVKSVINTRKE